MARKGKVFNNLGRPKLLRKQIPVAETVSGLLLLAAILGMTLWLVDQRDTYDPGERDISIELLVEQSVEDDLYKTPLLRWRDPALGEAAAIAIDLGPFDSALLTGGWRSPSTPRVFDPDTVYEKINGQADQYLKFGFETLTVVELEHPEEERTLDIYLYDQGSFEGSLGVYEEQRGDRPVVTHGRVRYTPNPIGAIGMAGRIFFHAIGDAPSPAIEALTVRIVAQLSRLAPDEPVPEGFTILRDRLEIPFEGIGYQPTNVFQYRFAERFWFARLEGGSDARLFVHVAESAESAKALFDRLSAELVEDYEVLDPGPDRFLLEHRFLKTHFCLVHDDRWVFGVERHPDREGATTATDGLRRAIGRSDPGDGIEEGSYGETEEGYR